MHIIFIINFIIIQKNEYHFYIINETTKNNKTKQLKTHTQKQDVPSRNVCQQFNRGFFRGKKTKDLSND